MTKLFRRIVRKELNDIFDVIIWHSYCEETGTLIRVQSIAWWLISIAIVEFFSNSALITGLTWVLGALSIKTW